jgi:hypothetical protein
MFSSRRYLMKTRKMILNILCCLAICLFASQAWAFMTGLSTEELTRSSDAVIVGGVEDVESHWNQDGTTIFTTASVVVEEVVRGVVMQQRVTVEYEGGEIGEIGLRVSDVAPLERGERVLLFLKSGKSRRDGSAYNIVGKAQGKYLVGEDGIARKRGFALSSHKDVVESETPLGRLIEKIRNVQ